MNRFGSVAAGNWQSGNNASGAVDISDLQDVVVMLGASVALSGGTTCTLQISWDGTTFVDWNAKTATGAFTTIPQAKAFRINTTAYSAGTPVVGFAGRVALP